MEEERLCRGCKNQTVIKISAGLLVTLTSDDLLLVAAGLVVAASAEPAKLPAPPGADLEAFAFAGASVSAATSLTVDVSAAAPSVS